MVFSRAGLAACQSSGVVSSWTQATPVSSGVIFGILASVSMRGGTARCASTRVVTDCIQNQAEGRVLLVISP